MRNLSTPAVAARRRTPGQRLVLLLKWAVTLGAFAFLLSRQPVSELLAAVRRVSPLAVATAILVLCSAVVLGTLRWRLVLRAYGAGHVPRTWALLYYNWVGFFYNTYLPGGVGGDLVRGFATRGAFGPSGTTRALAVVFIERVLGLAGLLTVISFAYALFPLPGLALPAYVAALGPLAALGAILSVSWGRRMGMELPGRLGDLFEALPTLARLGPLLGAFGLSLLNHVVVAVSGHVLVASMSDGVHFGQSLLAVPLSSAAVFIPVSVAGMGVRDTVLVALYERFGVDRAVALATALALLVCHFSAAGIGGLWQLLRPVPDAASDAGEPPAQV